MSVESMAKALNLTDPRLTPSAKLLLVGIANHDGDGGAWPSLATLSRYCGIKVRAVQYLINKLVDLGYLTVHSQAGGTLATRNDRRPNRYDLHLPEVIHRESHGVQPNAPREAPRGATQRANGVQPVAPEPSLEPSKPPLPPHDAIDPILDEAARRIVNHRENLGYGAGGPGALRTARAALDADLARRWLTEGHAPTDIARCLASRVTDPGTHATPQHYWRPPEREPEPDIERVRQLLGRG